MENWRLNKFIAHSGLCTRREAGELVKSGKILVNGVVEKNPAITVSLQDKVEYKGKEITIKKTLVYLLFNKPRKASWLKQSDEDKKAIKDLFGPMASSLAPADEPSYEHSGLMIISNDLELIEKLSEPGYQIKKVYHVVLDKDLKEEDFEAIKQELAHSKEEILFDSMAYFKNRKNELGLELRRGSNASVSGVFSKRAYEIRIFDRVLYGSLTKKNIPRGRYRILTKQEVIFLKHF